MNNILNITGVLCASNNTAANTGGFAYLAGGLLEVASGASVNVGDNTPETSTVHLDVYAGVVKVKCGADSPPWANRGSYFVQGPLCACSAAFEANKSTTCDRCGSLGWDADTCACVVSVVA